MPSKVFSGAIVGLDAQLVEVEVDVAQGLRSFSIVGLPDKAVKESSIVIKHSNIEYIHTKNLFRTVRETHFLVWCGENTRH